MLQVSPSGTKSKRASSGLYEYSVRFRWIPAGSGGSYRKCLRRFDCLVAAHILIPPNPTPPLYTLVLLNTIAPI